MFDWSTFGELFLQWLTLTFMLIGLLGLVIPIFPGIMVIWLSSLVYAILQAMAGRMGFWDWFLFVLITLLMVAGTFVDNIILAKKMRETGTPWKSISISYFAGLISSLFLTPFAALLISPLALYAVEYWRVRDKRLAFASTKGWLIGFGWSFLALFGIGMLMIIFWLLWIWL